MENWMSRIDDSKKIVLINIPGTHDSAAYCMNRISFKCAKTQELTIAQQLEIGIRDFDISLIVLFYCFIFFFFLILFCLP
jgi:1-phosphatidylinositol phosphodiesterase